jgi:hypothetical protein
MSESEGRVSFGKLEYEDRGFESLHFSVVSFVLRISALSLKEVKNL